MYTRMSMYEKLQLTNDLLKVINEDSNIQQSIATYGFDQTRLEQGKTLREQARDALAAYQVQRGLNLQTRDFLRKKNREMRILYMDSVALAREALAGRDDFLLALDLASPRREPMYDSDRWIGQAWNFYQNVNEEIQVALNRFGLTTELIAEQRAQLQTLSDSLVQEDLMRATLRERLGERRAAFEELDIWLHNFETVARIITRGDMVLRDKLKLNQRRRVTPEDPATASEPESPEGRPNAEAREPVLAAMSEKAGSNEPAAAEATPMSCGGDTMAI